MTYYIGIDIAKYHHDCTITDDNGEIIKHHFKFNNDNDGFSTLLDVLSNLNIASSQIKIGFESTGHYTSNLINFLIKNNYSFMEINPILVNRYFKASTLRKTKTDKKDSLIICSYLASVEFKPYLSKSYHIIVLKELTRARDSLVKQRSQQLIFITNTLDKCFPEFKPFFNNNLKSSTALYILRKYTTPDKISRMNSESYQLMKSKLRRTISYKKFLDLKHLAKNTIGSTNISSELLLSSYLNMYIHTSTEITKLETEITQMYNEIECYIDSIPGIGVISAASIISEIKDINNFNNPGQVLAFAGLDVAIYQSGESSYKGKMVKHGSSYLRKNLMNCAQYVIMHSPTFYEYYRLKKSQGKCHRVALSHVAKKLVRIIFSLEYQRTSFIEQI